MKVNETPSTSTQWNVFSQKTNKTQVQQNIKTFWCKIKIFNMKISLNIYRRLLSAFNVIASLWAAFNYLAKQVSRTLLFCSNLFSSNYRFALVESNDEVLIIFFLASDKTSVQHNKKLLFWALKFQKCFLFLWILLKAQITTDSSFSCLFCWTNRHWKSFLFIKFTQLFLLKARETELSILFWSCWVHETFVRLHRNKNYLVAYL